MANEKVTDMPALTTLEDTDLLEMVDDPAGSVDNVKVTLLTLRKHITGRVAFARKVDGDNSYALATWGDFDTATDLVLAALAGDVVEVGCLFEYQPESVTGFFDCASLVAASEVNYWGNDGAEDVAHEGVQGWKGANGISNSCGGSIMRTLVSGDLSGGNVTIRFRRRNGSAAAKVINSSVNQEWFGWAKNLGPVL